MHDQQETRIQRLSREKLLYIYTTAFANNDIDTLTTLWRVAERDPTLAHMFFEMHQVYENEERNENGMQSPHLSARNAVLEPIDIVVKKRARQSDRVKLLVQTCVAILVVAALLGSFLVFVSARHATGLPGIAGEHTVVASPVGSIVVAATSEGIVYGWQAVTGHEVWHYATGQQMGPPPGNDPGLIVKGNIVYYSSNGHVYALRLTNGQMLWQKYLGVPGFGGILEGNVPPMLLDQNVLFINGYAGGIGNVYALRLSDGKLLWHLTQGTNHLPLLTAGNGIAYTITDLNADGDLLLKAVRSIDGTELWHFQTNAMSGMVIENVVYVLAAPSHSASYGSPGALLAFNTQTGERVWSQDVNILNAGMRALVAGKNLLLVYNGEKFCAYRENDGTLAWCKPQDSGQGAYVPVYIATEKVLYLNQPGVKLVPSPAPNGNGTILLDQDFIDVIARDISTGDIQWTQHFNVERDQTPQIARDGNDGILLVSIGNECYAFNGQNGQKLWQKSFPDAHQQFISIQVLAA